MLYVGSGTPDRDLTLTETPGVEGGVQGKGTNRVQKTRSGPIPLPPGTSLPGTQDAFRLLPSPWSDVGAQSCTEQEVRMFSKTLMKCGLIHPLPQDKDQITRRHAS